MRKSVKMERDVSTVWEFFRQRRDMMVYDPDDYSDCQDLIDEFGYLPEVRVWESLKALEIMFRDEQDAMIFMVKWS